MAPSIHASPGSMDYPCEATQVHEALPCPSRSHGAGFSRNTETMGWPSPVPGCPRDARGVEASRRTRHARRHHRHHSPAWRLRSRHCARLCSPAPPGASPMFSCPGHGGGVPPEAYGCGASGRTVCGHGGVPRIDRDASRVYCPPIMQGCASVRRRRTVPSPPPLDDCQGEVCVGSGGVRSRMRRIFLIFHNPSARTARFR